MSEKKYVDYFAKVQYLQKHIGNEQMNITYEERMRFKSQVNSIIKNMDLKAKQIKDQNLKSYKLGSFYQKLQNKCADNKDHAHKECGDEQ